MITHKYCHLPFILNAVISLTHISFGLVVLKFLLGLLYVPAVKKERRLWPLNLYVDGIEIGSMNQYYQGGISQNTTSDWVNGKDFMFNYVGMDFIPFDNISVEYIQVKENGGETLALDYCAAKKVAPQCTVDGYTRYDCTACGAVFKIDTTPATGHSFGTYASNYDATCTADGTKTAKCADCGTESTVTDSGTAKGHSFGVWVVTKASTCTAEGAERRDCANCDHYETRSIAQTEHEWTSSITAESTCTEVGTERQSCRNCDAYMTNEIPALGHSWVDDTAPMKQCAVCGYAERTCNIQLGTEFAGMDTVWVDGQEYPVEDGVVTLESTASCLTVYGEEMKVWTLQWTGNHYETVYVPELDGLMAYYGSDIRTEDVPGIRIITAMERGIREALTGDGLAGYTLAETGTVMAYNGVTPILGQPDARSNYAYRKNEIDPIYKKTKDQILYTNVLVGYSSYQYEKVLSVRPYCILVDGSGNALTVYGAVLTTSIAQLIWE